MTNPDHSPIDPNELPALPSEANKIVMNAAETTPIPGIEMEVSQSPIVEPPTYSDEARALSDSQENNIEKPGTVLEAIAEESKHSASFHDARLEGEVDAPTSEQEDMNSDEEASETESSGSEPATQTELSPQETEVLKQKEEELKQKEEKLNEKEEKLNEKEEQLNQKEEALKQKEEQIEASHLQSSEVQTNEQDALSQIMGQAQSQDETDRQGDEKDYNQHLASFNDFAQRSNILQQGIKTIQQRFENDLLPACEMAKSQLPESIQTQLDSRHKSIQLIRRMLERRVQEFAEGGSESPSPTVAELPGLSREELSDLQKDSLSLEAFEKVIAQKLREISDRRYQAIFEMQTQSETAKKDLLNLVRRKVLDILDGLHSGEQNSKPVVDEIKEGALNEAEQHDLDQWFKIHVDLQEDIHQLLAEIQIYPMSVARGEPADYYRHEPIGVEPDAKLETEHIKEVVQRGYEYTLESGDPAETARTVLRLAQVIMVKN
jgi:molecular chaperone GrpE (heat shock protein)